MTIPRCSPQWFAGYDKQCAWLKYGADPDWMLSLVRCWDTPGIELAIRVSDAAATNLDIPGYAYNRNTHNLECLMLNLEKLYITDREEIRKILKLSDYGRLGNYVWKIFNGTNWSKVNSKGGYIISVLAREKRSTGS